MDSTSPKTSEEGYIFQTGDYVEIDPNGGLSYIPEWQRGTHRVYSGAKLKVGWVPKRFNEKKASSNNSSMTIHWLTIKGTWSSQTKYIPTKALRLVESYEERSKPILDDLISEMASGEFGFFEDQAPVMPDVLQEGQDLANTSYATADKVHPILVIKPRDKW